jgi:hypothetical protein
MTPLCAMLSAVSLLRPLPLTLPALLLDWPVHQLANGRILFSNMHFSAGLSLSISLSQFAKSHRYGAPSLRQLCRGGGLSASKDSNEM